MALRHARLHRHPEVAAWLSATFDRPPPTLRVFASEDCVVCLCPAPLTVFAPCGHSCACASCARQTGPSCPVCRTRVEKTYASA
jgi:hypothetical protein